MNDDPYRLPKELRERPRYFRPGFYTVKITDTEAVHSITGRRYCIVRARLVKVHQTISDEMIEDFEYTELMNADSDLGIQQAEHFILVCDPCLLPITDEAIIPSDTVLDIFRRRTGLIDKTLHLQVREYFTKKGDPVLRFDWSTPSS